MDARQRATYMRDEIIQLLAQEAGTLAHEPEPGKDVAKMMETLAAVETACRSVMLTLSTSSHAMYAERDLPDETAKDWQRAKHSLRIVRTLYGPQATPCDDPGAHA